MFGTLGDSAPDQWGRRLMRRAERRCAERKRQTPRTLFEADYLMGVADETGLGALRFRCAGESMFHKHLIFAPGSSLGGARPKA